VSLNRVSNAKFKVTVLSIHLKVVKERNVAVFNADSIERSLLTLFGDAVEIRE
jgi:hypothetical protein